MAIRFVSVSRHNQLMLNQLLRNSAKLLGTLLLLFIFTTGIAQEADTASAVAAPASSSGSAELISLGETTFNGNCTQCHAFNKVVVGSN